MLQNPPLLAFLSSVNSESDLCALCGNPFSFFCLSSFADELSVHYTRSRAILAHRPMPINTIIVDDEKPAREELTFLLKCFPEINLHAQGKNGLDAINLIKEHSPDLVFLDVQMPGLDGFGVLKKLVERKLKVPHVVFATAFDHYAVKAFDVNAVDYVLKPFDKARIAKAIQKAKREIEAQTSPTDRLEQLVAQLANAQTRLQAALQNPHQIPAAHAC